MLGILNLESSEKAAFDKHTLEKLSPLVAAAAVVLRKQRTFFELAESEKKAALGLIAAGVAHELNTVLNNIAHCADNISFETEEAERHRLLENAQKEVYRGSNIVHRLLELAHSDTEETKRCDINEVVREVVGLVERQLVTSNISIEMHLQPNPPLVEINDGRLKQVFLNIITNARQALKETGGGSLTIKTRLSPLGSYVKIAFVDTGPGMTEEQKKRVFYAFFTTKAPGQGTGLGLSISKRIVESFGGRISVESQLGKGATFIVSLPVLRKEEK